MTAQPRRRAQDEDDQPQPRRLALDDPAAQAWGARMLQTALERHRRRLAAEAEATNDRDDGR
jgi:hypothetical protein